MKTGKITCAALLAASILAASCDRTIHEYPVPQDSLIILEANVNRNQPLYFKEVIYDENGNRTEKELEEKEAQPYFPSDRLEMRIIMDIYKGDASEKSPSRERACRKIVYVENIADMPQDTMHVRLPDGKYYVLGWADYVLKEAHSGTYETDSLTNIRTDNVFIRYSYISQSSGFIGNIGDGGLTISFYAAIELDNCSAGYVEYIHDGTGEPYDYEPQHELYGHKNSGDKVTITPEA